MTVSIKQQEEMLEAAKPLMKWIAENFNPHCKAIVGPADVELVEGLATHGTLEFVED
jgi:hypothetical protein